MPDATLFMFFDHLALRWDAMQSADRDAHLARLLEPHATLFAGVRQVLDVGTGTGAFLPHLARLAPEACVTALDLSQVMIRLAQDSGRATQVCHWLRGDAHTLPLAREWVNLVTCHDSFAHFEDRLMALREFRRVLVPGGHLLILHDISRERVNRVHDRTGHPRVITHTLPPIEEIVPLVNEAGFTVLCAIDSAEQYVITARRT